MDGRHVGMEHPGTGGEGAEQERRELVLAAAEGSLTPEQLTRLDALRFDDVGVDREIEQMRATLEAVHGRALDWDESAMRATPDPAVLTAALARIEADRPTAMGQMRATHQAGDGEEAAGDTSTRQPGRRQVLWGLAAAGLVATGAVGNEVVRRAGEPGSPEAVAGPPGTLGALEPLSMSMSGAPAGARVDAALIAHTWGTETVLVVEGSDPGARYEVVLVARDGARIVSGGFLGTEAALDCEMNAAILREDVDQVVITAADGAVWGRAVLPQVGS